MNVVSLCVCSNDITDYQRQKSRCSTFGHLSWLDAVAEMSDKIDALSSVPLDRRPCRP
jgi:hypothetical protein